MKNWRMSLNLDDGRNRLKNWMMSLNLESYIEGSNTTGERKKSKETLQRTNMSPFAEVF